MPAAAAKTDFNYLESRFEYRFTKHGKRELEKLHDGEKGGVLERLGELEKYTWRQLVNLSREKGLTPEREGDVAFKKVCNRVEGGVCDEEVFPFHFRVPQVSKRFRIFGYQYKNVFYITQIDENHAQHRSG